MEKFLNTTFFRQIALQNLQRKNLGFSETGLINQISLLQRPENQSDLDTQTSEQCNSGGGGGGSSDVTVEINSQSKFGIEIVQEISNHVNVSTGTRSSCVQ